MVQSTIDDKVNQLVNDLLVRSTIF